MKWTRIKAHHDTLRVIQWGGAAIAVLSLIGFLWIAYTNLLVDFALVLGGLPAAETNFAFHGILASVMLGLALVGLVAMIVANHLDTPYQEKMNKREMEKILYGTQR